MIVLLVKAGTTQKLEKTILEENGCHIHRKKMPFFVTFAFLFVAVIKNKRSQRSIIGIGKRHIDATVDLHNFCFHIPVNEQLSNEAAKTETARKQEVRKNREVMKRLIDITLCLAQEGMAFRGHREVDEPSFFAEEEVLDETCTGNFRSVVNLLAKYDAPLSNHIRAVRNSKLKRRRNPIGKTKGKKSRSGRGNLVSFMSADSQNKIINSIGKQLQKFIVGEINAAVICSIAMDCTTDSSHADQLSIIIPYLNRSLDIVEGLVSVQRVKESPPSEKRVVSV